MAADIPEDVQFEEALRRLYGDAASDGFYSVIAGTRHRNPDGTSRPEAICKTVEWSPLLLDPEPDNTFDPNAVAVLSLAGQLGYLEGRAAKELTSQHRRGLCVWVAHLAHYNLHPETEEIVGATMRIVRLPPDHPLAAGDGETFVKRHDILAAAGQPVKLAAAEIAPCTVLPAATQLPSRGLDSSQIAVAVALAVGVLACLMLSLR